MNKEEFEKLTEVHEVSEFIDAKEVGGYDRTLLYGYTVDRRDFHVYLKDNHIFRVEFPGTMSMGLGISASRSVPDKRVYPESTDAHFARLLISRGIEIPFTRFDQKRYEALRRYPFHGPFHLNNVGLVRDRENGLIHLRGENS